VLERNATRLLRLVNALLDFSRLQAGRTQARYEPTDLAALTGDLASTFRSAIERAGMQLRVECDPLPSIYVDRSMWEKIVLNLLSNAFKFTFEGSIQVRLSARDRRALLIVADTGIGINREDLPRLFERFHRVEGARSRTHEGSGIGLALVNDLVKLHGGSVAVESEPGQGTRFTIELPFGTEHLDPQHIFHTSSPASGVHVADAFVQEALRWLPAESELVTEVTPVGPRRRVVVADDNADMREYVRRLLATRYEVEACSDGVRALDAIRGLKPELVLTDVMMPGLDGFGLLQAIRADPALRDIPVVMLSARSGEESRSEGLEAGADDYVVKPFGARELLARVATHLDMARIRADSMKRERELLADTQASRDQLERVLASINDAFVTLDHDGRVSYANRRAAELVGTTPEALTGVQLEEWEGAPYQQAEISFLRHAMEAQRGGTIETFFPRTGRWLEIRAYPYDGGLSLFATDITERKQADAALKQALANEQRAVRYRDEFLGIASHELWTPLSSMRLQIELTERAAARQGGVAAVPPARFEKLLDVLGRQVKNLDRLIMDLLDASRVANGRLTVELEPTDLVPVITAVASQFSEQLTAAGCSLSIDVPPTLTGHYDPRRLEQVLANLVTNAVKYAPGKPLSIRATQSSESVTIEVRDSGPGIAPEHQERIFGRFERASDRRNVSGLGLGLYVSREIVRNHSGRLWVESQPGQGASFFIELPRGESSAAGRAGSGA
jgi:PAS domain S-box-containing protein